MAKKTAWVGTFFVAIILVYIVVNYYADVSETKQPSAVNQTPPQNGQVQIEKENKQDALKLKPAISKPKGSEKKSDDSKILASPDKNPHYDTLSDRIEAMEKWIGEEQYTPEQIAEAQQSDDLWDLAKQTDSKGLPLTDSEKSDGRVFFQVNPAKLASTLPGDTLTFDLPDLGDKFEVKIQQVGSPVKNIVTWSGAMNELGESLNSFSMTRGKGYYSGHINTPTNTYSFEVFNNKGWIHESGALFTGEHPAVIEEPENHLSHDHH